MWQDFPSKHSLSCMNWHQLR